MKKIFKKLIITLLLGIIITGSIIYFNLPTTRMNYTSELVMLGDLDKDGKWGKADSILLEEFLLKPFDFSDKFSVLVDVNQNNQIDQEDIFILKALFVNPNPYETEKRIKAQGIIFPKPRELYKYFPTNEYIKRPLFLLQSSIINNSPLKIILDSITVESDGYEKQLRNEIYDEAIRFSFRYKQRIDSLSQTEKDYADKKIAHCIYLYQKNDLYNLLLNIISLVEDSETLSINNQSTFIKNSLYFREHIRELITSEMYKDFEVGEVEYTEILNQIEVYLKNDLDFILDFSTLESPRDFTKISNYIERAEWQYYKSKTSKQNFKDLILFAQHDRRYLRCVSKTNPKHQDIKVENHNLPMILLFREALNIMDGDKKAAIGMLDESIRIPFAWVKSLPKGKLPSSIAFENFLLPGNKEDGADKSRHWNVFGGISIYDSPEKALKISLQREINDLKETQYTKDAMDEFIRDLIANVNGIYYITSINTNKNPKQTK